MNEKREFQQAAFSNNPLRINLFTGDPKTLPGAIRQNPVFTTTLCAAAKTRWVIQGPKHRNDTLGIELTLSEKGWKPRREPDKNTVLILGNEGDTAAVLVICGPAWDTTQEYANELKKTCDIPENVGTLKERKCQIAGRQGIRLDFQRKVNDRLISFTCYCLVLEDRAFQFFATSAPGHEKEIEKVIQGFRLIK